jgi:iron complex outermembrane receptor protein
MLGSTPVTWTTGVDVSSQHDTRHEFTNAGVASPGARTQQGDPLLSQLERVQSVAPFAQVGVLLRSRWRLTTGLRYDHYRFEAVDRFLSDGNQSGRRTMAAVSPMAGVVHLTADWLNVYANVATAYSTPTTVQLSNRPTGEGGFNENLQPEDLRTIEAGARGHVERARLRYELTVYRTALTNALVSFQRADQQTYFENAGESRRKGAEVLLEWSPIAHVTTRLAYTHQDFRFVRFVSGQVDYAGNAEPGAPPNQWFVQGGYDAPFGVRSSIKLRWVDRYPVNNANTAFNWAYRVVDLRFGLDRAWNDVGIRPFVGIDNLFNERYNASTSSNAIGSRFYEPAPGREVFVGLTLGMGAR